MSPARQTVRAAAAVIFALSAIGLGACDTLERSIDCSRVCDKYQDCIDPDYDISACDSRCDENGDSQQLSGQIDACESCIDDKACGESTSDCDDECAGIVP